MKVNTILILAVLFFKISFSQNTSKGDTKVRKPMYYENDTIPKVFYSNNKKSKNYHHNNNIPVLYILDGEQIKDGLSSISPNRIESVKVEKDPIIIEGIEYSGKIIIKTKKDYFPNIMTVSDLISEYTKAENYIFSIDGNIINADKNTYLIDKRDIMKINIKELNKVNLSFKIFYISILTRSKKNLKKANEIKSNIRIRGSELTASK